MKWLMTKSFWKNNKGFINKFSDRKKQNKITNFKIKKLSILPITTIKIKIKSLMLINLIKKKLNQIPLWKKNELLLHLINSIEKLTHYLPYSIHLLFRIFFPHLLTSMFICALLNIAIFTIFNFDFSLILFSTL